MGFGSMKWLLRLAAVLFSFTLIASACSDDNSSSDTTGGDSNDVEVEGASETSGERPDDWPDSIVFAAVPAEQNERLQESYQVIIDIFQDELGFEEIEFFQAADYAGVIEAMIADEVDVAQFGPFSYVIAKGNGADIQPVGVMLSEEGVEPGYQSFGITQVDNDEVNSLADYKDRTICFVDPGSTSGFLYPSAGLLDEGIDPESDVEGVFAGGHDASAISVANGDCEAGFAFDTMVTNELIEAGDLTGVVDEVDDEEFGSDPQIRVIWKSEVIAASPLAASNQLPESLVEAMIEVLSEKVNITYAAENGYCESEETCALSDEDIWGYTYKDDSFYDGVRQVCEITESAECEGA